MVEAPANGASTADENAAAAEPPAASVEQAELVIKYQQGKERQRLVLHIQDCGGQEGSALVRVRQRVRLLDAHA